MRALYLKAAFITFIVASVLACGSAYVAAYLATSHLQNAVRMYSLFEIRTSHVFGVETKAGLYIIQCHQNKPGYIALLIIDEMNPWPLDTPGLRVPTAPPCP